MIVILALRFHDSTILEGRRLEKLAGVLESKNWNEGRAWTTSSSEVDG